MNARETWAVLPEDHDAAIKRLTDIIDSMVSLLSRERRLCATAVNHLHALRKENNKMMQQSICDAQNLSRLREQKSQLLKERELAHEKITELEERMRAGKG